MILEILFTGARWVVYESAFPDDGEIYPDWKDKIIGIKKYESVKLYPINDSLVGAILDGITYIATLVDYIFRTTTTQTHLLYEIIYNIIISL